MHLDKTLIRLCNTFRQELATLEQHNFTFLVLSKVLDFLHSLYITSNYLLLNNCAILVIN